VSGQSKEAGLRGRRGRALLATKLPLVQDGVAAKTMLATRPHRFSRLVVIVLACLLLPGGMGIAQAQTTNSTGARAGMQVRRPETPQSLYDKGLRQMKRGLWDDAVLSFEKVRNHFPFNQYSVLAELKIADCLYEKAAYPDAVDAYRQFRRLHPRHPQIDYVVLRTAKSFFKLAPLIAQRDQANSRRGLKQLEAYEVKFPQSEHIEEVMRVRERTLKRLARSVLQIGDFYWKNGKWRAAERRYRQAAEDYPQSAFTEKARYRQGICLWRLDRRGEARAALGSLAVSDPEGRWGKRAVAHLERHPPDADPAPPAP
jgi:outer membrane protein assembly factor BamD